MQILWANIGYYADCCLIPFYRLTGYALTDYFIGTFVLGMICVAVGELTVSLALKLNKRYLDELKAEIETKEQLSFNAYKAGDQRSYKALNKQATDAWGKQFFTMAAYSAGILWPLPFALAWLNMRFQAVDFPLAFPLSLLFGPSVGYTFTFIPIYILGRIIFKYLRPWLPYFRGVQSLLDKQKVKEAG